MATTNTKLETVEGWVEVDFTALTNRGGHPVEFASNATEPAETLNGHVLLANEGLSADELPDESIWFRATWGRVILAISA